MIKTYDMMNTSRGYDPDYEMVESVDHHGQPDGMGQWVSKEDHDARIAECSQATLALTDLLSRAREMQRAQLEYSIKLQRMIEHASRAGLEGRTDAIPNPELHHHKMLQGLVDRVLFLQEQLRIEQDERKSLEGRYAIIDARYKQVEERWHKLMERNDLQCSNRITNWDMQGGAGA